MIILFLVMHLVFSSTCSELTLFNLPKDMLNIVFTFVQNEKAYKDINRQRFFNYVYSPSDRPYHVALPSLAQVNKSFYDHFEKNLQLQFTKIYLKNNILTNIYLIDEKKRILLPIEKITCFFSDIPFGQKDDLKFTISELADWHLEKYSPSNINSWAEHFTNLKVAYPNIPESLRCANLDSLNDIKSTLQEHINTLTKTIKDIISELPEIPNNLINANEALAEFLKIKKINLCQKEKEHKDMSSAVEFGQIFNTLAQGILKEKYKSNIAFTALYAALHEKQKNRGLKIQKQKTILLKLLTIQMFAPYLNTDTHKNMLLDLRQHCFPTDDFTETLDVLINSFKKNVHHSWENDWNKTYSKLWSEKNFKLLAKSTMSDLLWVNAGLGLPYLPTTVDGTLDIDLSSTDFFKYYETIGLFKGTMPFTFFKNITTINYLVNNRIFPTACSLCSIIFFDILIKFSFVEPFLISNGVLTIDHESYPSDIWDELNKLHAKNATLYQSIIDRIKSVNILKAGSIEKQQPTSPFFDFLNNLPKNVEIKFEFLKDCIQNNVLNIDKSIYNSNTLRMLNTFRVNNKKLYKSIVSSIKKIHIKMDDFKYALSNTIAFFDFLNNLSKNVKIQFEFSKDFIENDVLNIDKSLYTRDTLEILNTFHDNYNKLYESIMSNVKKVKITTDIFKYKGSDSIACFDFINNLPKNVEIKFEFLKDFIQISKSPKAVSFIAAFLKRKTKHNNQLLMNSTLLPLLKYKDIESFKPFFENINTIVCSASNTKKLANIMKQWFLAINAENTQNDMQLKIVAPSEIIKKDFENSLYLTVFNSAIVNSRTKRPLFVVNDDETLKESYVFFIPKELMYTVYTLTPSICFCFCWLNDLYENAAFTNVDMIYYAAASINLTFILLENIIDCSFDPKILLISKLIHYIFISLIIYDSLFIYRSWLLNSIIALILIDYYHINKSSLFFNLMHAAAQTIKNRSCKPTNVSIAVEPTFDT